MSGTALNEISSNMLYFCDCLSILRGAFAVVSCPAILGSCLSGRPHFAPLRPTPDQFRAPSLTKLFGAKIHVASPIFVTKPLSAATRCFGIGVGCVERSFLCGWGMRVLGGHCRLFSMFCEVLWDFIRIFTCMHRPSFENDSESGSQSPPPNYTPARWMYSGDSQISWSFV